MFLSRIITFRYIAVKWYLRVYWLLPLSIVDSFGKHRRFFRRAPTILLLRTDDSFAEHRRLFCWAPWILGSINQLHFPKESFPYFNGLFFLFINTNNRQLGRSHIESTDIVYKNRFSCYCWQNGHAEPRSFVGPRQDMSLRCWRTGINKTEPLPWLTPSKKETIAGWLYLSLSTPLKNLLTPQKPSSESLKKWMKEEKPPRGCESHTLKEALADMGTNCLTEHRSPLPQGFTTGWDATSWLSRREWHAC